MAEVDVSTPKVQSADDIETLFNTEDEPEVKTPKVEKEEIEEEKPVKKAPKKEKDEEEEEPEIKIKDDEDDEKLDLEDDEEDDEEDEEIEEEEELEIDGPPKLKQLTAAYPDIIKKFPYLKKVLYRDREYTDLFGSFDNAKEVAGKVERLDEFESSLLSGKTEDVLISVKNADPKAYDKIIDDYLPTLARIDKEAYNHVTSNVVKLLIREMATAGKETDNEDLQAAALAINQFMFNTTKYTPPQNRIKEDDTKTEDAEKARLAEIHERFEDSRNDLQSRVDNALTNTINDYIDPKGEMTAFVKKNAVKEALVITQKLLEKDQYLSKNLDRLWREAVNSKFSRESLEKIRSTYLGAAKKTLLVSIKKARAEALKDMPKRPRTEDNEEEEEKTPRRRLHAGRPSPQHKANRMEKGESVMDFFNRD